MKLFIYKIAYDDRKVKAFEECVRTEELIAQHLATWPTTDTLEDADIAFVPMWNASLLHTHPALHKTAWNSTVKPLLRLDLDIPHFTVWAYALFHEDLSYISKHIAIWAFESQMSVPNSLQCVNGGCEDRMVVIPYNLETTTHHVAKATTKTNVNSTHFTAKHWNRRQRQLVFFSSPETETTDAPRPRTLRRQLAQALGAQMYVPSKTDPNQIFPTAKCVLVARGDTPTRKCFYQAISHGCFPVVTQDAFMVYADLFRGSFAREIEQISIVLPNRSLTNPPTPMWLETQIQQKMSTLQFCLDTMHKLAVSVISYDNGSVVKHALWATAHMTRKYVMTNTTFAYNLDRCYNTKVLPVTISTRETVTANSSSQYMTEPILHDQFSNNERAVAVLENATLAFIPLYTFLISWKPRAKYYNVDHCVKQIKAVQSQIPTWETSNIPHVLAFGDVLWDDRRVFWPHVQLPSNTVIVALEKASKCPYRTIAVPFPCGPVPPIPESPRPTFVCYIGRKRGITEQFNRTPGCAATHLDIPGWKSSNQDDALIWQTYHNSTFSWQPHGDRQTRRGFYQSVLAGCIPIVTEENVGGYADVLEGALHLDKACIVLPFVPTNPQEIVAHVQTINVAPILHHMSRVAPYLGNAAKMFEGLVPTILRSPWQVEVEEVLAQQYTHPEPETFLGPIGLKSLSEVFAEFKATYAYQGSNCLMGELKSYLVQDEMATNVNVVNFNFDKNFNGLVAVARDQRKDGRPMCLAKSNHYLLGDHGKPYNKRYHIYDNISFGYVYMCDGREPVHTMTEAALFANPFSGSNLGHDISLTLFMVHWYKQRKLSCPILLLSRVQNLPRILEVLRVFFDPNVFRFMPDEAVWHVETLHMFDSTKDSAFYNISKFPSMLDQIKAAALTKYGHLHFPPNVFLGKTHEQVQVLASETAIRCPELLNTLRKDASWFIVNPEVRELTLLKLVTMLQKASKIVTTTGSISYAHEMFFSNSARLFYLQTHRKPYHYVERYQIVAVNKKMTMTKAETLKIVTILTGT